MDIAGDERRTGTPGGRRSVRALATAVTVASLLVLGPLLVTARVDALGLLHAAGALVLLSVALLLLGGLLRAFEVAWVRVLRPGGDHLWTWLCTWTETLSRAPAPARSARAPEPGERVTMVVGLGLAALDVVLTTLLLRDVFPEPPYRIALGGRLPPAAADASFYVIVAVFKTLLELWFGMFDRLGRERGGEGRPGLRLFVLGAASIFDAALAASRGLFLAELGLDGAAIRVSNLLFVGFGLAIPWVVAHTGDVLVGAADPLLARLSPLRLMRQALRWTALALTWMVALTLGLPILVSLATLGIAAWIWRALESAVGMALGHEEDDAPGPELNALLESGGTP